MLFKSFDNSKEEWDVMSPLLPRSARQSVDATQSLRSCGLAGAGGTWLKQSELKPSCPLPGYPSLTKHYVLYNHHYYHG